MMGYVYLFILIHIRLASAVLSMILGTKEETESVKAAPPNQSFLNL
jgi:hypothetical protein